MKIAAITDDGKTISQHFGRATQYLVATIEDGKIVRRELRPKPGHNQFAGETHHHDEHHHQAHGMDASSHDKHLRMSDAIADCEALLCRGMGRGAYESMQQRGIRPVVTDITSIEVALMAYVDGSIIDHTERLH
jgi:predicted Fe-Mo cluster-binding NifX family protein